MRKIPITLPLVLALIVPQALAANAAPRDLTTAGSTLVAANEVAANEKANAQTSKSTSATPATPASPGTRGTSATPATPAMPNGGGPGSNPGNGHDRGKASRS